MWTFWPGFVAFAVALAAGLLVDGIARLPSKAAKVVAGIGFAFSLYAVINGGYQALANWEYVDLFGEAQRQDVRVSPKGGLALFLIQFWPFTSVVIGGMGMWIYAQIFRRDRRAR